MVRGRSHAGRVLLQIRRREAVGQQITQGDCLVGAVDTHHVNHEVNAAKFPHYLTADAAGRERAGDHAVLAAADGDGGEIPVAVVHSLEEGGALGAVGGAVGRIFDVAALVDRAIGTEQGGADLVAGVGGIRVGHGLLGQSNQLFRFHYKISFHNSIPLLHLREADKKPTYVYKDIHFIYI